MSPTAHSLQPNWDAPAIVRSSFSLRLGGVSRPPWDGLNLGRHVGDDPAAVEANRQALRAALALPDEPLWLGQVHGARALELDALWTGVERPVLPDADAIVTRQRGRVLAIMVADCLPVLFASRDGTTIGAAHAGWRGLASGVLEATVAALRVAPGELVAWFGPCIRQPHFEVGAEVRAAFVEGDEAAASAFTANANGRWQCDLPALARRRLARAGLTAISDCGRCTYAERAQFFSHRRDQRTGRMAALLWLPP